MLGAGCYVPQCYVLSTWHPAPGTQHHESTDYGQVIATIFTDDTSSVRMLALVPDVAAGRLAADGSDVVAPAAPLVLVAPDALADAALPVTVMRWPTWAARSPPRSVQLAAGPAEADALAPDD